MSGGHDLPLKGKRERRVGACPGGGGGGCMKKKIVWDSSFPLFGAFFLCVQNMYTFFPCGGHFFLYGEGSFFPHGGGVSIFGEPLVVTFFTAQIFIIFQDRGGLNF